MGRVDDIAKRFSLAGVLDEDRQAKQRFPVEEIEVAAIEDHPANVAYSMDEDGIKSLAESIRKDGLTDIPMVRRKPDGGFQMLSGHRRKAAYALLAKDDPAFGRMPCRIVEGVSDDQAVTLLHTANYFTRELNVIERAKATQALGIQVERMRAENPELKGVRTAELKAAIIRNQTGRNVSPATIKRQEQTARRVEQGLTEDWRSEAIEGNLSDTDIATLAAMDPRCPGEALQGEILRERRQGGHLQADPRSRRARGRGGRQARRQGPQDPAKSGGCSRRECRRRRLPARRDRALRARPAHDRGLKMSPQTDRSHGLILSPLANGRNLSSGPLG